MDGVVQAAVVPSVRDTFVTVRPSLVSKPGTLAIDRFIWPYVPFTLWAASLEAEVVGGALLSARSVAAGIYKSMVAAASVRSRPTGCRLWKATF